MLMRADRNAAAHMRDNYVDILIFFADRLRPSSGHSLLVERMSDRNALNFRHTGNSCHRRELINNDGVDDI